MSGENLQQAIDALCRDHALMRDIRDRFGPPPDRRRKPGFTALLRIIAEQQVSVAAAASIWQRVEDFLQQRPDPAATILRTADEDLAVLGLSRPKIRYFRALATAVQAGTLDIEALETMEDAAAITALTAIKGIGRWSAEIYLLFALERVNIWPAGDLALREGVRMALALKTRPDTSAMDELGEIWHPYRGAAACLLWHYYGGMRNLSRQSQQQLEKR